MKKKILLLMAVATMGLTAKTMAQVPNYVPTNGLVGYWPFNGNANDESGNGNNGTVNGATLTSDRFGNMGKAYSFDGVDDYIQCLNSGPSGNGPITLSFWYYSNSNSCQTAFSYGGSNWGTQFDAFINWYPNGSGPCFGPSFTAEGTGISWGSSATQLLSWHNVVIIIPQGSTDCTNLVLYLDGQIASTCAFANYGAPNLNFGNSNPIQIGKSYSPGSGPNPFNGNLDDIGIWNRALTQLEISNLYNPCQLSVSTQPANQTININNNAQFIVGSSDTNATYQWQTDLGLGFQNVSNAGQYSGATNDTLTVSNVSMSNNNQQFHCIINSGSCADTSNVAVLTINNNVGINEIAQHNLFSVFPNPAQNIMHVKADNKLIGSVFTIYDNIGKVVKSGKLNTANTTIELGNLSNGFYMFSVGENRKQSFKIIKE